MSTDVLTRSVGYYNGQYRITIPKHIAVALSIKNRERLQFFIKEGDIILRRQE